LFFGFYEEDYILKRSQGTQKSAIPAAKKERAADKKKQPPKAKPPDKVKAKCKKSYNRRKGLKKRKDGKKPLGRHSRNGKADDCPQKYCSGEQTTDPEGKKVAGRGRTSFQSLHSVMRRISS
jgi:hypothetical protein